MVSSLLDCPCHQSWCTNWSQRGLRKTSNSNITVITWSWKTSLNYILQINALLAWIFMYIYPVYMSLSIYKKVRINFSSFYKQVHSKDSIYQLNRITYTCSMIQYGWMLLTEKNVVVYSNNKLLFYVFLEIWSISFLCKHQYAFL